MSRHAWAYIVSILLTGAALSVLALLSGPLPSVSQWLTLAALVVLTTAAQYFEAEAPGRQSYYPHFVFLFAGVLLLHPFLFVLQVTIPHLIEWAQKRLSGSPLLRDWYIQPFNISMHIIAGVTARAVFVGLVGGSPSLVAIQAMSAGLVAAVAYGVLNHAIVGLVLLMARRISLRASGVFEIGNLLNDLVQLYLGYAAAVLWQLNPLLIIPALTPLVLIYQALKVPQLRKEAQTDEKTGLWNARYFGGILAAEMDRARRFGRPLALIMADLDLLRNINNTYGHLAGDTVLAGIGQIIRQTVREYDTAARFGGEEFAMLLPETQAVDAVAVAERLRQAVEAAEFTVTTSPSPIHATLSLGVACFPESGEAPDELVHQADVALYQAKLRGRNRVTSAADVPHFVKLGQVPAGDATTTTYAVALSPPATEAPVAASAASSATASAAASAEPPPAVKPPTAPSRDIKLGVLVGGVILAGLASTVGGVIIAPRPDMLTIGVLVLAAVFAELYPVNVYRYSTVSVSVTVNFAAALLTGIPGVACTSAAIVLVHYLRMKPLLYRTGYNWATHVLAGLAPLLVRGLFPDLFQVAAIPMLAAPMLVTALAYYALDTGLIATAISVQAGDSFGRLWREQFGWLLVHYMALCIMGWFLTIAYTAIGAWGVLVFALPVLMMRFAQQQYVERTEEGVEELRRMNAELARANSEVVGASRSIRQLNDDLFVTLSRIIDARDPFVHNHAAKVAEYATAIGMQMGLPTRRLEGLRQAAYLHDIGKIGITEQILHKSSELSSDEYDVVKAHAALGDDFLESSHGLRELAPFVRHHHEYWDGRGYPDGLRGEQIPLEARILSVCDAVEAMASDRPYHRAMSVNAIVRELESAAGTQFDPQVVSVFVKIAHREGANLIVNSARSLVEQRELAAEARRQRLGWAPVEQSAASAT